MSDHSKLKQLALGCRGEVIRSHGWVGMIEDADLLRRDELFLKECSPEAVLELIADLERSQRMLLAACMEMGAIGNALGADMNADGDELLGMVVELKAERDQLKADNEHARMRIKELDLLFGRYLLGMRSSVIEWQNGRGADAAMQWIWNGLAGPGELPPQNETQAQAYFDREMVAVDAGLEEVAAFFDARRAAKQVTP